MAQANINDVCDYIILRLRSEKGSDLNHLKLQKLLYYCQAWYLAFYGERLFNGKFQAWIHGPVNRKIYDRFADNKFMYSNISLDDIQNEDVESEFSRKVRRHIETVLDTYAQYSPTQLEEMTHKEKPWKVARIGVAPNERCEEIINEGTMETFYRNRLD
jgi:uncharacterized phage-associated protein